MNDSAGSVTPSSPAKVPLESDARRGFFLRFITGAISGLLGLIPAGIGLGFFLDPLLRKRQPVAAAGGATATDGFLPLEITIDALPADGTPISATVVNDRVDAWNRFQNVQIGTIWLRRTGPQEVVAFNASCPHLGCAVDYRSARGDFFCPCHTSAFNLEGERTNQIPPRGMDRLEVRIAADTGRLQVKFQNFRAGTPEQKPIT